MSDSNRNFFPPQAPTGFMRLVRNEDGDSRMFASGLGVDETPFSGDLAGFKIEFRSEPIELPDFPAPVHYYLASGDDEGPTAYVCMSNLTRSQAFRLGFDMGVAAGRGYVGTNPDEE